MTLYERLRPILFRLDPERVHNLTLQLLHTVGRSPAFERALRRSFHFETNNPVHAFGLEFPNALGLAAGYDKNGVAIRGLAALGFGHIELGTVTRVPQPGNPRPRVFRLRQDRALINRMGFPNAGAEQLVKRLGRPRPQGIILGVNIGKGASTPLEQASKDYLALLDTFYEKADYLAVNVSSPNTPGLRELQGQDVFDRLLSELVARREMHIRAGRGYTPILIKLSPDLSQADLDRACSTIIDSSLDGVIVANTTLDRAGLRSRERSEAGGLSGAPLRGRSTELIASVERFTQGRLPIIGVGGVFGPEDARSMLDAGAKLVQVFTGLIYEGPALPHRILKALRDR
jgi:dihydroorotate dehydrogenase